MPSSNEQIEVVPEFHGLGSLAVVHLDGLRGSRNKRVRVFAIGLEEIFIELSGGDIRGTAQNHPEEKEKL